MSAPGDNHAHFQAADASDNGSIREELQRILSGASFRSSKRCSEFLTFVVEQTLAGHQDELKERTLGVSLFGREPAYDTPGDPVVRVKANEVRKRLAQYYDDHGTSKLRIDLPAGSYVPVFRRMDSPPQAQAAASAAPASPRRPALWKLLLAPGLLVIVAAAVLWQRGQGSPLESFWRPVMASDRTPILCVGTSSHVWLLSDDFSAQLSSMLARDTQGKLDVKPQEAIPAANSYFSLGSVKSAIGLSVFLSSRGARPQLRLGVPLTIEDFRNHTIVAVGAFSNPYTLQRISEMRFRFERGTAAGKAWLEISDSQDPKKRWRVEESPFEPGQEDFALVTRMFDAVSKNAFVSLAGLNQFGTEAAAEFVTNPRYWDDLARRAPRGWESKNVQVVLRTAVLESHPTPPSVVETYYW